MKRILFLNYEYPPLGGGAGNATFYLLKEYAKIKDLEVDLVTSSVDKFKIEQHSPNIRIHFLDINKNGNFHFQSQKDLLTYAWKSFWYSRKLVSEKKFDLIHVFFGIPCGFVAMFLRLPYLVSLRGSDVPFYNERFYFLDKFVFRFISKIVWKFAYLVVALSKDLVNLAKKTSKNQKIEVIYNGINIQEFFPNEEILNNEKTFNVFFLGRLIQRKGVIYLLEAFKEVSCKYEKIRLFIAGDGPLKEEFESFVKKNNLRKKVIFLGRISHEETMEVFQKSHIFVLPSLNEALGNVTQEALASGLPIITTDTGASEIVGDGGIIVNKKSSKEIEDAIENLLKNENLRKKMAKKSREIALDMSWEKTAQKYVEIYKKINF